MPLYGYICPTLPPNSLLFRIIKIIPKISATRIATPTTIIMTSNTPNEAKFVKIFTVLAKRGLYMACLWSFVNKQNPKVGVVWVQIGEILHFRGMESLQLRIAKRTNNPRAHGLKPHKYFHPTTPPTLLHSERNFGRQCRRQHPHIVTLPISHILLEIPPLRQPLRHYRTVIPIKSIQTLTIAHTLTLPIATATIGTEGRLRRIHSEEIGEGGE